MKTLVPKIHTIRQPGQAFPDVVKYWSWILSGIILCSGTPLVAQQNCLASLKEVYRVSSAFDMKQGFFIDYEVTMAYGAEAETKTERLKSYGKNEKSVVESTGYRIVQDGSLIVSVIESTKTILLSPRGQSDALHQQLEKVWAGQDSLLTNAKKITCTPETMAGRETVRYTVVPHEEVTEKYGIAEFSIWAPPGPGKMVRSEVNYLQGPVKKMTVEVYDFRTSLQEEAFTGTAPDQVLVNGKLKQKYQGYKLIDSRKTTTSNGN